MNAFQSYLAGWYPFYATLAGVSATIAGLLFVSLSLRYQQLHQPSFASIRRFARQTFRSLLFLVVFALVFLIPTPSPLGIGIPLIILGCYALVITVRLLRQDRADPTPDLVRFKGATRVYVLSLITYVVLLLVGGLLLFSHVYGLFATVGLFIWSLAWATAGAMDLLVGERE